LSARLNLQRRGLLRRLALVLPALALTQARHARSAQLAPLSESDPSAQAQNYVTDASRAKGADPGSNCANCSLYGATSDATQGTCTLFAGKLVKAAGWCRAWSGL
jgi:high potential iron-sulfur protein